MACDKLSFDTFSEAQHVVNIAQGRKTNRHRANKIPKRAYKCPDCGKFHLTSKKNKNYKKKIRL